MKMFNFLKTKKKPDTQNLLRAQSDGKKNRAQFHELKISEVRSETAECVSIAFELPEHLRTDFQFYPGQYLTLRTQIDGQDVRRSYSICSSPLNEDLRVAVKKLDGGVFSVFANEQLKAGDRIQVMTPQGNFHTPILPEQKKNYVAFAAGSGITPILSILKSVMEIEKESTFTLFFGNSTSSSVIFREEIDGIKNTHMNRLKVHHILSKEDQGADALRGRIDTDKCTIFGEKFVDYSEVDTFFICGPEAMIHCVKDFLKDKGIPDQKVFFELFTTSENQQAKEKKALAKNGASIKSDTMTSSITVILDGDETHFSLDGDGKSVVDAAMDAGADVPFSCKGAVCCTCRAKVLEGEVEMDMNYALEPEEVEEGYVLTCQAHPRSERVVISYDE